MNPTPDRRYWILDPGLHRFGESIASQGIPEGGSEVETPFGMALLIDLTPTSQDYDKWVCDLCMEPILTVLGEEPFPVPMFGGNALCLNHFNEWSQPIDPQGLDHLEEEFGVPRAIIEGLSLQEIGWNPEYIGRKGYGLGDWPLRICDCPFCQEQAIDWRQQFRKALEGNPGYPDRRPGEMIRNDPASS